MTQVIITNSFRGGTGKSTIISNLGSYLASFGFKVILIDADVISPGAHAIFGLDQKSFSKTLTDYLMNGTDIRDIVYDISHNLSLPDNSLFLVPSSMLKGEITEFLQKKGSSDKLAKAVTLLEEAFEPDYIFIDTHPGLNEEFLVASGVTDTLLNVVRPDNQDYQGLEVSSSVAKKLGLKNYVVLNKVHRKLNKAKLIKTVEKSFELPIAGALPLSEDIILAQSQYVFTDRYPEHEFSQEIQRIAAKVFGVKPKEHLELMQDILMDVKKGVELEKLAHSKGVNQARCDRYLTNMLNEGFIKKEAKKGKEILSITEKGEKFLNKYKVIRKFVDNFRL